MKKLLISTILAICALSANACKPSFRTFHAWGYAKDYSIRVCEESNPVYKDGEVYNYKCGNWKDMYDIAYRTETPTKDGTLIKHGDVDDVNIVYPYGNKYGVVVVKFRWMCKLRPW